MDDYTLGYKIVDGKKMRYGYTTGTCAAAAARAAADILLGGAREREWVEVRTPQGRMLRLVPKDISSTGAAVSCAVRKDAGDDPDVTNGILVYARVEKNGGKEIIIEGGQGVGRVTKPGLDAPPGAAAINRVPLRMIRENVSEVCARYGFREGLTVTISIPDGEAIARRTFNPQLGITGGLSILGTSGFVEPMSDDGFIGAIRAEYSVLHAAGEHKVIITPGNYGKDFLAAHAASLGFKGEGQLPDGGRHEAGRCQTLANYGSSLEPDGGFNHGPHRQEEDISNEKPLWSVVNNGAVKCGNFIGESLDMAAEFGFTSVLIVGHIGKLIKLVTGNFNTHSKYGDGRLEILAAYAGCEGVEKEVIMEILECATTEHAIELLVEAKCWDAVLSRVLGAIQAKLDHRCVTQCVSQCVSRCGGKIRAGAVLFSSVMGLLGCTPAAEQLWSQWSVL
jgi:cobalt-precorrin-5B (C1)-methyltransferase